MGIFDRLFGDKTGQHTIRKEDGDVVIGGERFILSYQTVEDRETGLVWARDANMAGRQTWHHTQDKYIVKLSGQRFAGYWDWRLPTKEELQILIDYAKSQGHTRRIEELFNKIGFKNVQSDSYWSSTSYANIPDNAWIVVMWEGVMSVGNKSSDYYYVWPVCSRKRII